MFWFYKLNFWLTCTLYTSALWEPRPFRWQETRAWQYTSRRRWWVNPLPFSLFSTPWEAAHGAALWAHHCSVPLIIKLQIQHIARHTSDSSDFSLSIPPTAAVCSSTESSSVANTISSTLVEAAGGECLHACFCSWSFNVLFEILALPRDPHALLLSSSAGDASLFFPFGLVLGGWDRLVTIWCWATAFSVCFIALWDLWDMVVVDSLLPASCITCCSLQTSFNPRCMTWIYVLPIYITCKTMSYAQHHIGRNWLQPVADRSLLEPVGNWSHFRQWMLATSPHRFWSSCPIWWKYRDRSGSGFSKKGNKNRTGPDFDTLIMHLIIHVKRQLKRKK